MKENKTFIATPITEELLKTLIDSEDYFAISNGGIKNYFKGMFLKANQGAGYKSILIEQPLPSSVTEITNNMDRSDIIRIETQAYDNGYRAGLMANKTISPYFPSDEEIEKKLLHLFGFLNEEIQAIDAKNQLKIQEFMKWLLSYKEQTKNKGGKELQINKEWSKQCAEISQYGEQMLTESRRLLQECIKSFEMQGVNCDELKKHCFMIEPSVEEESQDQDELWLQLLEFIWQNNDKLPLKLIQLKSKFKITKI